jgi:hypothetical protein
MARTVHIRTRVSTPRIEYANNNKLGGNTCCKVALQWTEVIYKLYIMIRPFHHNNTPPRNGRYYDVYPKYGSNGINFGSVVNTRSFMTRTN